MRVTFQKCIPNQLLLLSLVERILRPDGEDCRERLGDEGHERDDWRWNSRASLESGTSRYCGGGGRTDGSGRSWISMTSPRSSLATAAGHANSDMRTVLRSPRTTAVTVKRIRSRGTSASSSGKTC